MPPAPAGALPAAPGRRTGLGLFGLLALHGGGRGVRLLSPGLWARPGARPCFKGQEGEVPKYLWKEVEGGNR